MLLLAKHKHTGLTHKRVGKKTLAKRNSLLNRK